MIYEDDDELCIRSTPLVLCWDHTTFDVDVGFCVWCEVERLRTLVEDLEKMKGEFEAVNKWQNALDDKDRRIEELKEERETILLIMKKLEGK